jgi:beta-glucosidase
VFTAHDPIWRSCTAAPRYASTTSDSPDALLEQLTVAEQVSLLAGVDAWHTASVDRLGIPPLRVTDGPAGARGTQHRDGPASLNVPCGTALAATWDPDLVELIGELLGREARAKGAGVLLAPTVNLHRTPIGGRNFECMSEDPYLTARMAVAYVRGVQAEGVASCIKHFVGNDTEFERISIDSQIDERTLRELYLVPFEAAVTEAGVLAVMTGYNRINGPFAADSQPMLRGVLRGDWGFDGLVMSDWFGLHSTVEGLAAGLDLEMPGPTRFRGDLLLEAIERGDVTVEHVREAARNVLNLMDRVGALHADGPGPELTRDDPDDRALIRAAAASGMVLLRNEAGADGAPALPLVTDALSRVAVIGPNAALGQVMGGGSAHVTPTAVIHPLAAITERLTAHGVDVIHSPDTAVAADVAIVVVGTDDEIESEGRDRTDIELPGEQDELIRNVAAVNERTIVVVNAGSPVAMPWLDDVEAVLVAWFPGQEMGAALVDVLFGDVEPQGRLPVTFPRRIEDTPAFEHHPGRGGVAAYVERRLVGYRWYDTVGRDPLFPFGHGLGYADVSIERARATDPFSVEAELTNASDRDGIAVVQVYAHRASHDGAGDEPAQRLVGFTKIDVPSNGSATATVGLDPRTYMTWDVDSHAWIDVTGEFELRVGTSSRQIAARLQQQR